MIKKNPYDQEHKSLEKIMKARWPSCADRQDLSTQVETRENSHQKIKKAAENIGLLQSAYELADLPRVIPSAPRLTIDLTGRFNMNKGILEFSWELRYKRTVISYSDCGGEPAIF